MRWLSCFVEGLLKGEAAGSIKDSSLEVQEMELVLCRV